MRKTQNCDGVQSFGSSLGIDVIRFQIFQQLELVDCIHFECRFHLCVTHYGPLAIRILQLILLDVRPHVAQSVGSAPACPLNDLCESRRILNDLEQAHFP